MPFSELTGSDFDLVAQAAALAPSFFRAFGMAMFMPLLSDSFARMQWRIGFALWFAVLATVATPALPSASLSLIAFGFLQGMLVGTLGRLIVASTQMAGGVIATQIGLQQVVMPNPAEGQQTTSVELLLYFIGLKIFVHAGLLAHLLTARVGLEVWRDASAGDAVHLVQSALSSSFVAAFGIALPFIVLNFAFAIGLGLANVFLSAVPMFTIAQPIQMGAGLVLLGALIVDPLFTRVLTDLLDAIQP
jgi:flagellar biosynthesis protein FliR